MKKKQEERKRNCLTRGVDDDVITIIVTVVSCCLTHHSRQVWLGTGVSSHLPAGPVCFYVLGAAVGHADSVL